VGRVFSIHSSRGGTGKTVIAVNLAMTLLKKGFNVSLLDLDFRAPSLFHIFKDGIKNHVKFWLNDFFNGRCRLNQTLIEAKNLFSTDNKLLIGFANPSLYAIRDMMGKGALFEVSALKKLYRMRSFLLNELKMDFVIYDTSPGIQYSSINAITSSDICIVVSTSNPVDIEGVRTMLSEFYDIFEKKTLILINKAFPETDLITVEKSELLNWIERDKHEVIGMIPCYCDVLKAKGDYLSILKNPYHSFTKKIEEIADKLVKF